MLVGILLVANIINIGADLAAMAAARELVAGRRRACLRRWASRCCRTGLQLFIPYQALCAGTEMADVQPVRLCRGDAPGPDGLAGAALLGMVWPRELRSRGQSTIVAIFGTTISPYLFFWQSSQEAEEARGPTRQQGAEANPPSRRRNARYPRMRFDTLVGNGVLEPHSPRDHHSPPPPRLHAGRDDRDPTPPPRLPWPLQADRWTLSHSGCLRSGSSAPGFSPCRARRIRAPSRSRDAGGTQGPRIQATAGDGVLRDHRRRDRARRCSTGRRLDPIQALFWSAVLKGRGGRR